MLGLRRGEALGLTWQDVNLDAAELAVTWQLQRSRGQLYHRETKTATSEATLPLPDICVTALKLRAERQRRDRATSGDAWQETGLVFTTAHGTPYEPRNFARHFALRCKKADVRYIKVHDTRRTCGSLRHSKIAITMEIYTEVPDARTRDALRRLGEHLDG
ncbi:MAG TPA: tyrosine-type recombinase/integrase [Acidobacteriaceae bacterium]|nr:tyrosine-type recombinase/integrase [Acidobacteriaceae bacterium]